MRDKVLTWLYRIFSYFVPSGIALYLFLIDKLIDKEISVATKLGISGIFVLVIMVIIAVFFLGKFFRKKIAKLTDEIIVCMDNEKKSKLIAKKNKISSIQEIFHNALFIVPFVICYILVSMVERSMISMRTTLFYVCLSMSIGFGFNCVKEYLKNKN